MCLVAEISNAQAPDVDLWDAESWGHEPDIAVGEPGIVPSDEPDLAAQEKPKPRGPVFEFSDHRFSVNAMLGFGTPVGLAGGVLEINPLSPLALGVGAGANTEGLQLAVMARTRPFAWSLKRHALAITVGAALATGPHRPVQLSVPVGIDHSSPEERAREVDHVYERVFWLQPDLGFELQAKSGFHLVVSSGAALPVSHSGDHCVFQQSGEPAACPTPRSPESLPTTTVILGFAF